jgi:hypothetical protein
MSVNLSYKEIKRAFDPLNILKAGELYPPTSVDYFCRAWGVTIRRYDIIEEPLYDAEDWLWALCGVEHGAFYFRQFAAANGFFMGSQADNIYAMFIDEEGKRWVGTAAGMRMIAIHLCSRRSRKGLDRTRIDIHACYIAGSVCMSEDMQRSEEVKDAVLAFFAGERLDLWEEAINKIEDIT